jgi:RNA polymerase sigma-70 factor (ECF subfamily)
MTFPHSGPSGPAPSSSAAAGAPDAEDATRAQRGDAAAFERLYHRHSARVYSLARRLVGPAEAEDGTQEVFIRAWEKLALFRGDAAFGTWLHRLAVNHLLGRLETLKGRWDREGEDDDALEQLHHRPSTPEFDMDFENAVERLPAGARTIYVLHDVEGYKHEEIGKMLGISPGTSKSQLNRARLALRAYVEK